MSLTVEVSISPSHAVFVTQLVGPERPDGGPRNLVELGTHTGGDPIRMTPAQAVHVASLLLRAAEKEL